jgi:hypothetical protein
MCFCNEVTADESDHHVFFLVDTVVDEFVRAKGESDRIPTCRSGTHHDLASGAFDSG